jgi:hypothetical protein
MFDILAEGQANRIVTIDWVLMDITWFNCPILVESNTQISVNYRCTTGVRTITSYPSVFNVFVRKVPAFRQTEIAGNRLIQHTLDHPRHYSHRKRPRAL